MAAKKKDNDALVEMRQRYERASDYWRDLYDKARDDIKFVAVPGNQWPEDLKKRRGNRPSYEFPKLRMLCQQIINEQKQSRPQGKVRGVGEDDRGLAELMQGLCRNIESTSNAPQAYDIAFECAVRGGFGVWRVMTDYASPDDFDLDIRIKAVRNPFAVKFDPAAIEIDRRDGLFLFFEDKVPRETFERKYPDADVNGFFDNKECEKWRDAGQVIEAEYWYKKPVKRELWRLSNGAQVFADEAGYDEAQLGSIGITVVKRRQVDGHKVCMRITNGHEFLTEETEFPCRYIPFVPTYGNIDSIDGADYFSGAVRFSKDQQRLHNVHRTAAVEAVAKAPKAPFITKLSWIKGHEAQWKNANSEDYPFLPISEDAPNDAMPKRAGQAEVPAALIALGNMDNDDMRAQSGQYAANLGAPSNESSGKAIGMRRQQGATATFNYIDNLVYAIQFTYEILVDMLPKVIDTPRVVRILGPDGGEKWKQLYQEVEDPATGQKHVVNDISKGKYDVTVDVGPSFATQRMETAEALTQLIGQVGPAMPPQMAAVMAYEVVKALDAQGGDEMSEVFRTMLVKAGTLPPKEGDQPPQPPQPNPKDLATAKRDDAQARKYTAEAQGQEIENRMTVATLTAPPPPLMGPPGLMAPPQIPPPQGGFFMPDGASPPGG